MRKEFNSLKNVSVEILAGAPSSNYFSLAKISYKKKVPFVYRHSAAIIMKDAIKNGTDVNVYEYERVYKKNDKGENVY